MKKSIVMRKHLKKIISTALICIAFTVSSHNSVAQNGYLTPNNIKRKPLLKPGLPNQQLKKERYLGSRLIYSTEESLREIFTKDVGLSKACQRGRFKQIKSMQYIAVVEGRKYGAALYQTSMLHDPKKLAEKDRIYLFKGQGTSNCRVYHKRI
ncbi:hypothetical protein [Kiloniella sp. EL199]|uniref:hypothetical protein n=1 Tax=Kiloniella sp. EL199 TaxID=2107581 RepID=UPI000EA1DCD6|nr:hypothetical protein [Kiloniella sp. EL199]